MNNLNEKLSEALEIQPLEIKQSTEIVEIKDVVDDDAEFARQNIRDLIVKGNDAASHIVEIAKQSEHPRAFEVAAGMLKNLLAINRWLFVTGAGWCVVTISALISIEVIVRAFGGEGFVWLIDVTGLILLIFFFCIKHENCF
jgi:hypothetical protein